MFEIISLRKIFECRREEITGERGKLHNEEALHLYTVTRYQVAENRTDLVTGSYVHSIVPFGSIKVTDFLTI